MNSSNKRKTFWIGSFLFVLIGSLLLFPLPRLYVSAVFGYSDAMYRLSHHYFTVPERVLYHEISTSERTYWNSRYQKGDYWLRRSLQKGNMSALLFITGASGNGGYFSAKEQGDWLLHGCDLGIPWCAEELSEGYGGGRFGLTMNRGKSREYDDLSVELHRKKGTLKDHVCRFLPGTSLGVSANSPYSPFTQREVHPGILRATLTMK
jgi:hypothetical protein